LLIADEVQLATKLLDGCAIVELNCWNWSWFSALQKFTKNLKHVCERKFIDVYVHQKVIKIELGLTNLLQKVKQCSFLTHVKLIEYHLQW